VRLLLDTHALLWWFGDDPALSGSARRRIANAEEVLVSAASAWEIATKFRLGKLPTASVLIDDFLGYLSRERFKTLPISAEHALRAGLLAGPHQDPFGRMLIAQAQAEGMAIVSNDEVFDRYGVRRVW
jgi:PIN domain nuclease of toxin-antitoxin system